MARWLAPNLPGIILIVFFASFQALCGDTAPTHVPGVVLEMIDEEVEMTATTFGYPTWIEITCVRRQITDVDVRWLRLLGVALAGWIVPMALGRLMIDGGAHSDVLKLLLGGVPVVGLAQVVRRVLDRRRAMRQFVIDKVVPDDETRFQIVP